MTKQEIQTFLKTYHHDFLAYINKLNDEDFLFCPPHKWSAGQQLDHIYRSVQPLTLALFVPSWVLKLWMGKANRPSKSYEDLVSKYHQKLAEGGLEKYSESDLDLIILPHPLLGKITLREMMYFTIYHVQHHQKIAENTLSAK